MKEVLKLLLLVSLPTMYFGNLYLMFNYEPLTILMANIVVWVIIFAIPGIIAFIDWLND